MRVLITGAGLVGVHTARALASAGHQPLLLDLAPDHRYVAAIADRPVPTMRGDVTDPTVVLEALRDHRADAVVHTAGLLGRACQRYPVLAFRVNGGAPAAVAEAARHAGVRRLVHISSLAVYDWSAVTPDQASVAESFPTSARTPYGASKLAGELAVSCYQAAGWLDVTVLRLAGTYGPGQFRGGSALGPRVQHMVATALRGEPVTVTPQLAGHEYLHAGDVASAIRLVLEHQLAGTHNIGTGHTYSIVDVQAALSAAVPAARVHTTDHAPLISVALDLHGVRAALPDWSCRTLAAGLTEMAATLRQHPWLTKEDGE